MSCARITRRWPGQARPRLAARGIVPESGPLHLQGSGLPWVGAGPFKGPAASAVTGRSVRLRPAHARFRAPPPAGQSSASQPGPATPCPARGCRCAAGHGRRGAVVYGIAAFAHLEHDPAGALRICLQAGAGLEAAIRALAGRVGHPVTVAAAIPGADCRVLVHAGPAAAPATADTLVICD